MNPYQKADLNKHYVTVLVAVISALVLVAGIFIATLGSFVLLTGGDKITGYTFFAIGMIMPIASIIGATIWLMPRLFADFDREAEASQLKSVSDKELEALFRLD